MHRGNRLQFVCASGECPAQYRSRTSPPNAQGADRSVRHDRGAARSWVPGRGTGDDPASRIPRLPERLARRQFEAQHHFVRLLTAEGEQSIVDENGRGVPSAERYSPLRGTIRWPNPGHAGPAGLSIAVGTTPPRPVLGQKAGPCEEKDRAHHGYAPAVAVSHGNQASLDRLQRGGRITAPGLRAHRVRRGVGWTSRGRGRGPSRRTTPRRPVWRGSLPAPARCRPIPRSCCFRQPSCR